MSESESESEIVPASQSFHVSLRKREELSGRRAIGTEDEARKLLERGES